MTFKTRQYTVNKTVSPHWTHQKEDFYMEGYTSPRYPNGNLELKHNPYEKAHYRNVSAMAFGTDPGTSDWVYPAPFGNVTPYSPLGSQVSARTATAAGNRAYAKFLNLLRNGQGASLGVTFGSASQAVDMVSNRLQGVADYVNRTIPPPHYKIPANMYLETIFGWVPLYEDALNAMHTYVLHRPEERDMFISASGRARERYAYKAAGYPITTDEGEWQTRVTWSAKAGVTNPNLWLANKLGLLNLAGVAWDLVPWSWVAGMFGNFNQVLSSATDLVGIDLVDQSVTTTHRWGGRANVENLWDKAYNGWSVYDNFTISRTVGTPLRPHLLRRFPELNAGLAATAAALAAQAWSSRKRDIQIHHHRYITQKGLPPEYWYL